MFEINVGFLIFIVILLAWFLLFAGEIIDRIRVWCGVLVLTQKSRSFRWCGQAYYIHKKMNELIRISKDLGILKKEILPIRLRVARLKRGKLPLANANYNSSLITFYDDYMEALNNDLYGIDLDATLAHEFAHLLAGSLSPHARCCQHGSEWRAIFGHLYREFADPAERDSWLRGFKF